MLASYVGTARHLASVRDGRQPANGCSAADGLSVHITGAAGELAYAKARGVYYVPTINHFHQTDVADRHVRTRTRGHFDLIIRPDDPPGIYVLVIAEPPAFTIVGEISRLAVCDEWLQTYGDRPAAWFVPQSELHPPAECKKAGALA
jgi:hypothetical protein